MLGTLLWQCFLAIDLRGAGLFTSLRLSSALIGAYLGVSWAGVSICLLALGFATGRMWREIPGLWPPLKVQIAVWLVGAVAEETWRVVAITALLTDGYSRFYAVIAGCVAFGTGHLRMGLQRSAIAALEGMFLGFLFLWQGSFLALLTAHLAIHAVYLWGVGEFAQDWDGRKRWQIPGTKCPVCQTPLKLLHIKLGLVFECPSCKEPLSLSDGYQNVMRFTAALGFCSLILATILILHLWLPDNLVFWSAYPLSYGAATSALLLYKRAFTGLFPPRLQRGTPYFITRPQRPPRIELGQR